jgi:ABC-type Co2+ transport system permease subunit
MSTAHPSSSARFLTVVSVLVAGVCGGLIGWAVADLQCSGDCTVQTGIGGLIGAVLAAMGTSLICVLAIQAMAEWREQEGRRRVD